MAREKSELKSGMGKAMETFAALTVDYGQTLDAMIAAGRYDWKNDDITAKHFPVQGEGQAEVEITLVHIGRDMSTDNVLKELDTRGLRPAKIEELLALGASQPELQRQFPIIALGSIGRCPHGRRRVAYLGRDGAKRCLRLLWCEDVWRGICRFAAVRKS